jgi:zinc protease
MSLAAAAAVGAERKRRAPVSRETLVVKFPEADAVKLSNGVTVVAVEDGRFPIATVSFRTEGAGPIYSPSPGIAELTADMLREGSTSLSGKQIVESAARLGASITVSAQGGAEAAGLDGAGLVGRWTEWFRLLTTLTRQPTFPADDFTSLRQRWLLNLRVRPGQSGLAAEDALIRITYGGHPAGVAVPSAESLASITPETLAAFHRERYTPSNTVLLSIGRIDGAAFRAEAEKLLGDWKGPDTKPSLPPEPQPAPKRRIILIDRPGAAQTEIAIGNLLFTRRDPDYFPMVLANSVLGGNPTARLASILRDEKGYAYNAGSLHNTPRFTGFWRARAGVRSDATGETVSIMLAQLRRLCDEPVPADEIETAKRSSAGSFALNLEHLGNVMTLSYLRYRYGFSSDYWERYPARLNAVTASEIQAVAQKYLNPDRAHIVAVGDAARIRPALAKLGSVESA